MKNLKAYTKSTKDFYDTVSSKKRNPKGDPDFKDRLNILKSVIETPYDDYDKKFNDNELINLSPISLESQQKSDLQSMYSYKAKAFQKLKIEVTTIDKNTKFDTCQNCTINSVNSLDHFIPKEEFSEFSVNPKNLCPSCSQCNGIKNKYWKGDDNFLFLNLFLDILPDKKYLVSEIEWTDNIPVPTFRVENLEGIDADLFEVIESHYSRLNLPTRFKEKSNEIISTFTNTVTSYPKSITLDELRQSVKETIQKDKKIFGFNYWISVLQESLINDDTFINQYCSGYRAD